MEDYCREAAGLIIPKRIHALERHQYRGLGDTSGGIILETAIPQKIKKLGCVYNKFIKRKSLLSKSSPQL